MARGRPKGSKNRPKVIETSPGAGHNSEMTDEVRQARVMQSKDKFLAALQKKKDAASDFLSVCRSIKAELGGDAIEDIKLAIELESEEGQAKLKADMERRAKVAAWFGLEVGTQGSLFAPDRVPIEDKARAEGKRVGMEGKLRSAPSHYPQAVAECWYQGYDAGQAVVRDQMKDAFTAPPMEFPSDKLDTAFDDALEDEGDSDEIADEGEDDEFESDADADEDVEEAAV